MVYGCVVATKNAFTLSLKDFVFDNDDATDRKNLVPVPLRSEMIVPIFPI